MKSIITSVFWIVLGLLGFIVLIFLSALLEVVVKVIIAIVGAGLFIYGIYKVVLFFFTKNEET